MKTKTYKCLGGAISLTTLAALVILGGVQMPVFASSDPCCRGNDISTELNRGYLSTPRAREEFPWLTRGIRTVKPRAVTTDLTTNRALASSPRFIEEHPELLRAAGIHVLTTQFSVPAEITKNAALAASPRAREEFPALQRGPLPLERSDKFQIAPLK